MNGRESSKLTPWGDSVLDAYLDGELDTTQCAAVERQLDGDAEAAAYVRHGRQVRQDLHRLFDGRLESPLPPSHVELGLEIERLSDRPPQIPWSQPQPRASWFRLPVQLAAAAVLTIVILGAMAFGLRALVGGPSDQDLFALFSSTPTDSAPDSMLPATDGEAALPEATLTVTGTDSDTDSGMGALPGVELGAPDFGLFGFDLVSARLLASRDDNAMQLVYESEAGSRVELFYSPDPESQETSLTVMEDGPVSALFWRAAGRSYSLIGDVDREVILEMGRAVNGEWTAPLPDPTTGSSSLGGELDSNGDGLSDIPAMTTDDGVATSVAGEESL